MDGLCWHRHNMNDVFADSASAGARLGGCESQTTVCVGMNHSPPLPAASSEASSSSSALLTQLGASSWTQFLQADGFPRHPSTNSDDARAQQRMCMSYTLSGIQMDTPPAGPRQDHLQQLYPFDSCNPTHLPARLPHGPAHSTAALGTQPSAAHYSTPPLQGAMLPTTQPLPWTLGYATNSPSPSPQLYPAAASTHWAQHAPQTHDTLNTNQQAWSQTSSPMLPAAPSLWTLPSVPSTHTLPAVPPAPRRSSDSAGPAGTEAEATLQHAGSGVLSATSTGCDMTLDPDQLPLRLDAGSSLLQDLLHSVQPNAPCSASPPSSSVLSGKTKSTDTASEVHTPYAVLSPSEQQHIQELNAARKKLAKLLREMQDGSMGKIKCRLAQVLPGALRLLDRLDEQVQQHQQQQRRHRAVRMQLASAERELRCMQLEAPAPASSALAPPAPAGALVSVLQLPPAAEWDAGWDERVRRLQTLDVLHLHRHWLQHSSMLLSKVQLLQGTPLGMQVSGQLEELYIRYDFLVQRIMRLVPAMWHESAQYSLDTMQRLPRLPDPKEVHNVLMTYMPELVKKLLPIRLHYAETFAALDQQCSQLQRQYEQLPPDSSSSGSLSGSWTAPRGDVQVDEVLRQLQANLLQQQLQRAAFVHAINFGLPVEDMLQIKLLMYPLALNGQEVSYEAYVP